MPSGPIGKRKHRVRKALYWHWTQDMSQEEIGEKLNVSRSTVADYIAEAPQSPAVQEQLEDLEAQVRYSAAEKLRDQLKEAGRRAESAEKPVKVWQDGNGNLCVKTKRNDAGNVVDLYPVPVDIEMGPDEQARYYGRSEVREILDLLTDIVGAKAAERHKLEHSGEVNGEFSVTINNEHVSDE